MGITSDWHRPIQCVTFVKADTQLMYRRCLMRWYTVIALASGWHMRKFFSFVSPIQMLFSGFMRMLNVPDLHATMHKDSSLSEHWIWIQIPCNLIQSKHDCKVTHRSVPTLILSITRHYRPIHFTNIIALGILSLERLQICVLHSLYYTVWTLAVAEKTHMGVAVPAASAKFLNGFFLICTLTVLPAFPTPVHY